MILFIQYNNTTFFCCLWFCRSPFRHFSCKLFIRSNSFRSKLQLHIYMYVCMFIQQLYVFMFYDHQKNFLTLVLKNALKVSSFHFWLHNIFVFIKRQQTSSFNTLLYAYIHVHVFKRIFPARPAIWKEIFIFAFAVTTRFYLLNLCFSKIFSCFPAHLHTNVSAFCLHINLLMCMYLFLACKMLHCLFVLWHLPTIRVNCVFCGL